DARLGGAGAALELVGVHRGLAGGGELAPQGRRFLGKLGDPRLGAAESRVADLAEELNTLRRELAGVTDAGARVEELTVEVERLRGRLEGQSEETRAAHEELEAEKAKRQAAEDRVVALQDKLESASGAAPPPPDGSPLKAASEHLGVLNDSLGSLRQQMRTASDETAVMDQTAPVEIVSTALSQAAEDIERAREAVRALLDLVPPS
ncbi:MAG: hypothetical protein K8M05_28390, partial [Deltaproteobacteria bacterium]|nr:hypothetical protein [Kofleriaceae bacterium]